MQDQTSNTLQQPRADVQQGTSQQPQQPVTPGVSDSVSPLLSEPAPSGQLEVQQAVGSPNSSVQPVAPISSDGYGWVLALLIIPVLLLGWLFLPRALDAVEEEVIPEPQPKEPAPTKKKSAKKSQSRAKRKKSTKR